MIPFEFIRNTDEVLGSGRFGVCKKGYLQGTAVCLKYMNCKNKADEQKLVHREACVLSRLSHPSVCYLHGIQMEGDQCTSLVMSLYVIDDIVVTVHDLLSSDSPNASSNALLQSLCSSLHIQRWIVIFCQVADGIAYIHARGIIHRDLKTDNIVFYKNAGTPYPVIVDFGKAQTATTTQKYRLSEEQKQMYRAHHSHIAPDLIDGSSKPSYCSDMFSFGHVMKSVVCYFPLPASQLPRKFVAIVKKCLLYHSLDRPCAKTVYRELQLLAV